MKVFTIIAGIIVLIGGVFCLLTPGVTFLSIGWLVGLMLVIAGASSIADYVTLRRTGLVRGVDLLMGILTTAMGLFLLLSGSLQLITEVVALVLLGVWMVVGGLLRVVEAFQLRGVPGSGWGWFLFIGILMVGLGVYSFIHPSVGLLTLAYLIGFNVILAGVDLISFGMSLRKVENPSTGEEHWTLTH